MSFEQIESVRDSDNNFLAVKANGLRTKSNLIRCRAARSNDVKVLCAFDVNFFVRANIYPRVHCVPVLVSDTLVERVCLSTSNSLQRFLHCLSPFSIGGLCPCANASDHAKMEPFRPSC